MQITVKLIGPLRQKIDGHQNGELRMDITAGSTVEDALASLGLGDKVRMLMLNGRAVLDNRPLADGDRLTLIPPQLAYNMYVATGFLSPAVRDRIRRAQEEAD